MIILDQVIELKDASLLPLFPDNRFAIHFDSLIPSDHFVSIMAGAHREWQVQHFLCAERQNDHWVEQLGVFLDLVV